MVEAGLEATVEAVITQEMTASALGSGDVPVLATPVVVAMAERAACQALEGHVLDGQTSVGSSIDLSHLAPTRVGGTIWATARLAEVSGRKLSFDLWMADEAGEIARGRHVRVLVDRGRFLADAASRSKPER